MRFTEEMSKFLVEIVKENEEDLFPSSQKKDSRKTQEDAWKFVHSEITNQFPTSGITLQHCKDKWKNLKQTAKGDVQRKKRERNATGGGPEPSSSSSSSSAMIQDMFALKPSFQGIPKGRETALYKNTKADREVLNYLEQERENLDTEEILVENDFEENTSVMEIHEEPLAKKSNKTITPRMMTPKPTKLTTSHILELQADVLERQRDQAIVGQHFFEKGLEVLEKLEGLIGQMNNSN